MSKNPFKQAKISLQQMALNITKKNIEKNNSVKNGIKNIKKIKYRKKKGNKFNITKTDSGMVCYIPSSMRTKGFNRKIENNIEEIEKFKNNNNKILKL